MKDDKIKNQEYDPANLIDEMVGRENSVDEYLDNLQEPSVGELTELLLEEEKEK